MKKYFLVCIFVFTLQYTNAQEEKHNESGSWYTLVNKFKFSEKFSVSNVTQIRIVDFIENTRIFLVAPGVNYKLGKTATASAGYMYLNFSQEGIRIPSVDYENRLYEAVSFSSTFGKIKMNQRFMLEQRYLTKLNGSELYQNRFRYRINLDFNIAKFKNGKHLLGKVTEELRIRFASGFDEPQFDQNNFGVFLGYQLLDNSKIYAGYQRNYYNLGDYWGDHLLHIMFCYDFDFSKKK
ncbi:MAG: DUF2490 domain-containing protein [Bacteroidetes bacterium]|nr:DUF2490 domain-containing protein [Bacteroidota bacterium]